MDRIKKLVSNGFEVKIQRVNSLNTLIIRKGTGITDIRVVSHSLEKAVEEAYNKVKGTLTGGFEIVIDGHEGTWYVLEMKAFPFGYVYWLESEQYGDGAMQLFVNESKYVLLQDDNNGWEEFEFFLDNVECEHCEKTLRQILMAGKQLDSYGERELCSDCVTKINESVPSTFEF